MKEEITFDELALKGGDEYLIVDIRDGAAFEYGHIPGSINLSAEEAENFEYPENKEIYVCCRSGLQSYDVAEALRGKGYASYNLKGGYMEWLRHHIADNDYTEKAKQVEDSIRKRFHKKLFSRFCKAIVEYKLISPNDKIAVCISGGKDSFLMAKLFQELKRHNKVPFELVFLVMNPGYSKENMEIIEANAKMLNVPITVFESDIFESVFNIEKSPCYLCARMRRGNLYANAKALGCNKIALGHHYDDVIETILMGMLYGGQMQTMMPKLKSDNFEGMELIRPMYLIREEHVKAWRDANNLRFIQCACKFTDTCATCNPAGTGSKRQKVKQLIAQLEKEDPGIEQNIFRSVENVNLKTVIAYKDKDGARHNFVDEY
jgi:tRNA(Ile)-lysidine synthase TilS/MesJ/rhodanese-related sulfurtransferase